MPLWRSRPTAFDMLPADGVRRRRSPTASISRKATPTPICRHARGPNRREHRHGVRGAGPQGVLRRDRPRPGRYILLTQGHVDHVGGVDLFREAGTEIVAHANNAAQQAYDARLAPFRTSERVSRSPRRSTRMARPQGGAAAGAVAADADDHVQDRYAFTLGGERFELIGCPGAETEDSLVVWLPERGICFTGNVFGALFGHFPNLVTIRGDRHRDALRYVETLERLIALDAETLLVGHFDPVVGRASSAPSSSA